jgi:asparagine synthase (glutamine-hydrolysing)
LRADVKIGSALSGGLDSSSVVYLVSQLLRENESQPEQETFSSVYRSAGTTDCDESAYIRDVANFLAVHSNTIEPAVEDVPAEHRKMIWAMDTPPESSLMSSWHTFKLVRERGVKVTLDGQGADEQLAGYEPYLANWLYDAPFPAGLHRLYKLAAVHPMRIAAKNAARALAVRFLPARLLGGVFGHHALVHRLSAGLNQTLADDSVSSLITLLHYADRTSMAFSVESRMPFLDFRLAEFLASIPSTYKIRNGWTKMPARLAFHGRLPATVVWRKDKQGWPVPETHWFGGPLRKWFDNQEAGGLRTCRELGLHVSATPGATIDKRLRVVNLRVWAELFLGRSSQR